MAEEYGSGISSIVVVSKWMGGSSSVVNPVLRQQVSWLSSPKILMVLAMLSLAGTPVSADDKPLLRFLSPAVKAEGAITYSITSGVDLLLPFEGVEPNDTNDTKAKLELYITPFVGEQGDNFAVQPYILELPNL